MNTSDDVWQAIHWLSQILDAQFPAKVRAGPSPPAEQPTRKSSTPSFPRKADLRSVAALLCERSDQLRQRREQETQYVLCSLEELLGLIQEIGSESKMQD